MRTHLLSGIAAGFVLMAAVACGGNSATQAPQSTVTGPTTVPQTQGVASQAAGGAPTCSAGIGTGQQVAIAGFKFTPDSVSVSAGGTVSWTNGDTTAHTVTFDSGPDCGNVAGGASTTATFPAAGTYAYHCTIHPQMKGTVTVS